MIQIPTKDLLGPLLEQIDVDYLNNCEEFHTIDSHQQRMVLKLHMIYIDSMQCSRTKQLFK